MIPGELADFLRSGLAAYLATRDGSLNPDGTCAWAITVDDDLGHVTAYVATAAAAPMLRNLESHPRVALSASRPTSHRSCQIKGTFEGARTCAGIEREEVERQMLAYRRELASIGIPLAMTATWGGWPCVAIRFRVTDVFEQTPGPGAGEPLR